MSGDVSVNAITGSTGAGVKPGATTHFSWRNNNMSIYKAFNHQHVPEICQSLRALQPDFDGAIDFIPYRGDFARGIFATEVVRVDASADAGYFAGLYKEYYKDAAFTHYVDKAIDMKHGHDRQLAQRRQRAGRAEHEPHVRAGRNVRFAPEIVRILNGGATECHI